jgi:putative flippase GtrA
VPKFKHEFLHLLRYAASGVLNTLVGMSAILVLTLAVGLPPFAANIGGYLISLSIGFFISKKYIFFSGGHVAAESMRYVFSFALCFVLNLLVLWIALNLLHINVVIAQLLAAGTYTLAMYPLSRWFVFQFNSSKNPK